MLIKVQNLVKRYGDFLALDHFDMEVQEGEILGLLGPNGSGKTTAINCMLSLLRFDMGEIRLFGKPVSRGGRETLGQIGIVPQNVAVFQELSVYENVDYFCSLYVSDRTRRKSLVERALSFTALEEYQRHLPPKLSGGLLRRLNIACGIAHEPRLIFLDEPTVAVDPQSRNRILESIRTLNREGATIVYTSHYMEEVEQLCTRILIMDRGKAIAQGSAEQLKGMVRSGDRLTIEIPALPETVLQRIRAVDGASRVEYDGETLRARCSMQGRTFIDILDLLRREELSFGRVFTEPPTLNDVFLEITGKQLRD